MRFLRFRAIVAALAAACVLPPPALALDIQPGLWQDSVSGEMNGKPIPRKTSTNCVTPAQTRDVVKRARAGLKKSMKDLKRKCRKLDIRKDGNVVTFEMQCGGKQGAVEATTVITVHSPRHTTNVAKSTVDFMGQKMVSTITTDSKWIAAKCKK